MEPITMQPINTFSRPGTPRGWELQSFILNEARNPENNPINLWIKTNAKAKELGKETPFLPEIMRVLEAV
jgi:hypothetical protein